MLGREVVEDAGSALVPGEGTQLSLRFVASHAERVGSNRRHLHLTSASPADQPNTVAEALRLGAHHVDVGQRPEETHVVLADPEGNEFCVIEAGNTFLAGRHQGRVGRPAGGPDQGRNRQRFDLALPIHGDQRAEVDRLVSLGATRLGVGRMASYSPIPTATSSVC